MNQKGSHHLTIDERKMIEFLLNKELSCNAIAFELNKDSRTVSREVQHHRQLKVNERYLLFNRPSNIPCKCLCRFPYVCNGCKRRQSCFVKNRYYYDAHNAQKEYELGLSEVRIGMDVSEEDFIRYNQAIKDGIEHGQSVHHIVTTNYNVPYSTSSVYRHIDEQLLSIKAVDLRRKVKLKPRKHYIPKENNCKIREGRRYEDFLHEMSILNPLSICEIDTVEGPAEGVHKCLLTIHFTATHFMKIYVLNSKTKENVSKVFAELQTTLGTELFQKLFRVTLTDRGTEFCNPSAIEKDIKTGEKICKLFYCNSYSSYQKGAIEENHELIRYIIPKGTEFDFLTQEQADLIASHINSYQRKTIEATPYELAVAYYGEEFVQKIKTNSVTPELVCLKPSLLH